MDLNKFLPIENYTLASQLSVDEINKRIAENVEPEKVFRFSILKNKNTKPYQGQVSDDAFEMSRIISYRNSFLPMITGQVNSYLGQTLIKIKMRPVISVIIFMAIWLGGVGLVFFSLLIKEFLPSRGVLHENLSTGIFATSGMFLFGWCLSYFGFKYESKKSKQFLASLFEGQEIKQLSGF